MKTKYFYNAFNILYDLVKESLGIFQKEELYRQLFQAIYVMSGDALYDNDSIRKITSGNQTIHLRAVKKLHTPEGFEKFRRDINDEYLKQLDKIIRHAKDAFASVTVNISDGSCIMANSRIASLELKDVNEPLDSYIERISQSIPQREVRTQYRKVFCVDNLRECLTQGKDMIQWECPVYAAKGISLRMIRTTVEMVRNVSYDRLEALLYFSDITENYFSEQIPHMLYRKNFDRIEIIDGQRDCVRLDHPGICAMEMVLAEEISYSGYVTEVMKKFVPDDEKSVYEKCVRLDTIRKELQEKDR